VKLAGTAERLDGEKMRAKIDIHETTSAPAPTVSLQCSLGAVYLYTKGCVPYQWSGGKILCEETRRANEQSVDGKDSAGDL
jgi:hypothetical protein